MIKKVPYQLFKYERLKTNPVKVGNLTIGGNAPIVIQSMCNTSTSDVFASVKQAIEIFDAGGQMVRYTVIHQKDAEALKEIRAELSKQGYNQPIVADVHFNAELANIAAQYVEKVRINPGNFVDKRAKFENTTYSENQWNEELKKVEKKLIELIQICRTNHTALRIGTNHGSLSDRIMSRYGNTVEGMVESTMEFLRICKKEKFENVVVSLKSSNVKVMVTAYRSIVTAMHGENMHFPLHLGVTEAGNGLSGRIKSASGIGALLNDGLGDTIRVSLTEHPAKEIPVAKSIISHFANRNDKSIFQPPSIQYHPLEISQRYIETATDIETKHPVVVVDLRHLEEINEEDIEALGYIKKGDQWEPTRRTVEYAYTNTTKINTTAPEGFKFLYESYLDGKPCKRTAPILTRAEYLKLYKLTRLKEKWVYIRLEELTDEMIGILNNDNHVVIILETTHPHGTADQRSFFMHLAEHKLQHPVIIKRNYVEDDPIQMAIKAAADIAPLFTDGYGNGIWITNPFITDAKIAHEISFEVLQATRARSTSTEFIACPSCGRTQFDIEKVLEEVKEKTKHLYHLKIGVMGCLVNGPGEMADADYGYVGAAPGKVSLYKGKTQVRKNIPAAQAVDELIELIKTNGDWLEK
jgi:(E)-4-hydroxy-3-methylbut-2-enyl-diphosphate synthase